MSQFVGRVWVLLALMAATTACKREPTFDERYADAQKVIRAKASELDQDMATRAADADANEVLATEPTAGQPASAGPASK